MTVRRESEEVRRLGILEGGKMKRIDLVVLEGIPIVGYQNTPFGDVDL